MEEEWRQIVGYEGLYEVSNMGRVRSYHGKVVRTLRLLNVKGYRVVSLGDGSEFCRPRYVHTLVLEAFRGPRPEGYDSSHLDGTRDKTTLTTFCGKPEKRMWRVLRNTGHGLGVNATVRRNSPLVL